MKRTLIFVLFLLAIGLTYTSMTPHNSVLLLLSVALGLIAASMLLAFLLSPWYKGNFKERFKSGLKFAFILSNSSYILGYLFILIESLIRG